MAGRRPRDRKATIITTAASLFAERGYDAVSLHDIAAALDMRGPSIYSHFPSKKALLGAVFLHTMTELAASIDPGDDHPSPEDLVQRVVTATLDQQAGLVALDNDGYRIDPFSLPGMADVVATFNLHTLALHLALSPGVDLPTVGIRSQAILGSMAGTAYESFGIVRPRLDELLAQSVLALARTPSSRPPELPPTPKPTWAPPRTRRDQILDAAAPLFRSQTYDGVAINDIGEAAGLSGPGVYRHFAAKADIWLAATELTALRTLVGARDALAAADSAADALVRLARSYLRVALDPSGVLALPFHYRRIPEFRTMTTPHYGPMLACWAGVMGELRPELTEDEQRQLTNNVFPLMLQASTAVLGQYGWLDELAALAVAYLTG